MADNDLAKIEMLELALYDSARNNGDSKKLFGQRDLMDLGIIPGNDLQLLLAVIQALTREKLFVPKQDSRGGLAWTWRSRDDANKFLALPNEETAMVYEFIEDVGADGAWTRTIRNKLKMQDSTVKQCIKWLEQHRYISDMKSVEHPNKKMYIKANLKPSDRATGGVWVTDGQLDVAFVDEVERFVFFYIRKITLYQSRSGRSKTPSKGIVQGNAVVARGAKRSVTEMSQDDKHGTSAPATPQAANRRERGACLPMPAGFTKHPTTQDIAFAIHRANLVKGNTTLTENDVQQLVDVLIYDGLIEMVRQGGKKGYRIAMPPKQSAMSDFKDLIALDTKNQEQGNEGTWMGVVPGSNAFTEAPCGNCPVFDLCEEGGPVHPGNCVYFQRWLGLDLEP